MFARNVSLPFFLRAALASLHRAASSMDPNTFSCDSGGESTDNCDNNYEFQAPRYHDFLSAENWHDDADAYFGMVAIASTLLEMRVDRTDGEWFSVAHH
jgi:hypothetical protein